MWVRLVPLIGVLILSVVCDDSLNYEGSGDEDGYGHGNKNGIEDENQHYGKISIDNDPIGENVIKPEGGVDNGSDDFINVTGSNNNTKLLENSTTSTTSTTKPTTSTTKSTTSTTKSTTSTTKSTTSTTKSTTPSQLTSTPTTNGDNELNLFAGFKWNYLYFLLLLIPIGSIPIAIMYCRRRKKDVYTEPSEKSNRSRRQSIPSWVFSEPDFADEEIVTLQEKK